jgi:hypothetical protein
MGLVDIDLHHARLNDVEKLLCHSNHRLALGAAALKRRPCLDLSFPQARVPWNSPWRTGSIHRLGIAAAVGCHWHTLGELAQWNEVHASDYELDQPRAVQ